ncbi:hypothetical protein V1515DRAFT_609216 [Lipomyces mesembrius]
MRILSISNCPTRHNRMKSLKDIISQMSKLHLSDRRKGERSALGRRSKQVRNYSSNRGSAAKTTPYHFILGSSWGNLVLKEIQDGRFTAKGIKAIRGAMVGYAAYLKSHCILMVGKKMRRMSGITNRQLGSLGTQPVREMTQKRDCSELFETTENHESSSRTRRIEGEYTGTPQDKSAAGEEGFRVFRANPDPRRNAGEERNEITPAVQSKALNAARLDRTKRSCEWNGKQHNILSKVGREVSVGEVCLQEKIQRLQVSKSIQCKLPRAYSLEDMCWY